jgi:hypothetical protein
MTTRNDITGDEIKTKKITAKYRENFDRIFGSLKPLPQSEVDKIVEAMEKIKGEK